MTEYKIKLDAASHTVEVREIWGFYRVLLAKYMQLVIDMESVDYLDMVGCHGSKVDFSAEELAELRRISAETLP